LELMGDVQVVEVRGTSGAEYQLEVHVMWDSPSEKVNVRVMGPIDDRHLPAALVPLGGSLESANAATGESQL